MKHSGTRRQLLSVHEEPRPPAIDATDSDASPRVMGEFLAARTWARLTQAQVARSMGTTKSAISRMEGLSGPSPTLATMQRYAGAVGCSLEIRLRPLPLD